MKPPYVIEEYKSFKEELNSILNNYDNVNLMNYERVVPPGAWGEKDSTNLRGELEIDFMHFTEEGHRLLADKLFQQIKNYAF